MVARWSARIDTTKKSRDRESSDTDFSAQSRGRTSISPWILTESKYERIIPANDTHG